MTSSAESAPPAGARAVVTGASGFVGSHLCERLAQLGVDVTALVRPGTDRRRLDGAGDGVRVVELDLADPDADLAPAVRGAGAVYHLAAAGVDQSRSDAAAIVAVNVAGTVRLLQAAAGAGVSRFVYCGSCFEYPAGHGLTEDVLPCPATEYAASKAAGWLMAGAFARRHGLPVVSLRPFTVYGPREAPGRLVPEAVGRALRSLPVETTSGRQTRDLVYVADAVEAFVAAWRNGAPGETFNVCTGTATTVRQAVELVLEITGSPAGARFGARPDRAGELYELTGDPTRAREGLGWSASTGVREGLERTVAWWRDRLAVGTRG
ncbi:MAG TPA: NAD-dependent epimerase/dehydratase family protein [Candidatus Dormibacteraeota bacterium]|nr:NAD-dependent epimerase/dehydratase family protein [Candidatus Dormibacteraeota bacterium]